jgi:hypothetical protein
MKNTQRSSISTKRSRLKKGHTVLAEWRRGKWYVGTVVRVTQKETTVRFLNRNEKQFTDRSFSRMLRFKSTLHFGRSTSGPYGDDHAQMLAQMRSRVWPDKRPWVIGWIFFGAKNVRPYVRQWRVGVLLKASTKRCSVLFNDGDREHYDRSEQVRYISHAQPYVLSGPYEFNQFERLGVTVKQSPLPPPKPPKVTKQEKPAFAEKGQRVIALKSDEWHLGTIVDMRKPTGLWAWEDPFPIVIIKFDDGFTYGYPHAVERFWPISTDFADRGGPYTQSRADAIIKQFGLKRKEPSGASTQPLGEEASTVG